MDEASFAGICYNRRRRLPVSRANASSEKSAMTMKKTDIQFLEGSPEASKSFSADSELTILTDSIKTDCLEASNLSSASARLTFESGGTKRDDATIFSPLNGLLADTQESSTKILQSAGGLHGDSGFAKMRAALKDSDVIQQHRTDDSFSSASLQQSHGCSGQMLDGDAQRNISLTHRTIVLEAPRIESLVWNGTMPFVDLDIGGQSPEESFRSYCGDHWGNLTVCGPANAWIWG